MMGDGVVVGVGVGVVEGGRGGNFWPNTILGKARYGTHANVDFKNSLR